MKSESATMIVVVEEDPRLRETLSAAVDGQSVHLIRVRNGVEAENVLNADPVDVLIVPLRSGKTDGVKLLRRAQQTHENIAVILTVESNTLDTDTADRLMRDGAYDYLTKPVNAEKLRSVVQRAIRQQTLLRENRFLQKRLSDETAALGFTGKSPKMRALYDRLIQLASSPNTTVLILGESGTGKELAARALHAHSLRRSGPFVSFNCAGLPETLIESELFGHEEGSFTGASRRRKGRFELAHGGTLFLDEIGEMDLSGQAKLLRVLETREFERVGGEKSVRVDVRIVAATNRNLEEAVKSGRFREDLYHRLRVGTLAMPPLRERVEDIPFLVNVFIREFREATGKPVRSVTPRALRILERHSWQGNVRELKNCIEAMVVLSPNDTLDIQDIPEWIQPSAESERVPQVISTWRNDLPYTPVTASAALDEDAPKRIPVHVGMTCREIERETIRVTLDATRGNKAEAARTLDMGRRTLFRKLKEYDL